MMSRIPADYVYVDDERLDRYTTQITSPVRYDKVPTFSAQIGFVPNVQLKQERVQRDLTQSEKIRILLDHLEKLHAVKEGRVRTGWGRRLEEDEVFRLETCTASHVFIPPTTPEDLAGKRYALPAEESEEGLLLPLKRSEREREMDRARRARQEERARLIEAARREIAEFQGLHLWISHSRYSAPLTTIPEPETQLLLVAGFRRDDQAFAPAHSAYSALVGLFDEVSDLRRSILFEVESRIRSNPGAEFQQRFLADPFGALRSVGAPDDPPRTIRTLYRVRQVLGYGTPQGEAVATIGYPIFIAAEGA